MNKRSEEFTNRIMPMFVEAAFSARETSPDDDFKISEDEKHSLGELFSLSEGEAAAMCFLAEKKAEDSLFGLQIELVRHGIKL